MSFQELPSTCHLLVNRLGSGVHDAEAWNRFVTVYGPHIISWCRGYGLQEADANDVAQEVLLKICRVIPRFEYDPTRTFRGWLRTVVHSAWYDWTAERRRAAQGGLQQRDVGDSLEDAPARQELLQRLEAAFDQELLQSAQQRVRGRVEPRTWQIFEWLAIEQRPAGEVAELLGMRLGSVQAARYKVQKLLREEVEALENLK
ncbi:MAG: RNA polymerase sigma factor [Planctomycetaceae bacterium]